jgi:hypothetical protein
MKMHLCVGDGHYEEKIDCGEDHVLVLGKISWDFRILKDIDQWGSKLLNLPEMCKISRSYQQSSWSVFDQAKTLSFLAVINFNSAVL